MSEPKLISPLLDDFAMGEPISAHDGVRCCPAMRRDSDKKYIVKIISVPASPAQLDALLLTGAYPNQDAARDYFHDLAQGLAGEAELLGRLAASDGFLPFEGCQCVPMEPEVGYDLYLLSPYRRSLARQFQKAPLTHLGAVNLGMDLCAALAISRRAGQLYVDLKPENVFITETGRFCIGDVGFVPISSLKYAALPGRCHSRYTAPELADPMATLNPTIDIYALGLILYQVYNGGNLPFVGNAPAEQLPPPMYADYEMAEIILKACAPDPASRWADPIAMGQALRAYMQRNGANDTPIVPPPAPKPEPAPPAEPEPEPVEPSEEETPEQLPPEDAEIPQPEDTAEPDELAFIRELVSDETAPGADGGDSLTDAALTLDGSEILSKADELIAHEAPAPAVAPEPVEIPMPEPIPEEPEEAEAPEEAVEAPSPEELEERRRRRRKTVKRVVTTLVVLVLLAAVAVGGWFFYTEYYLQDVTNVSLEGHEDSLAVHIQSEADESLLSVRLTDTFGNSNDAMVKDGTAWFHELTPNSQYTVELSISGVHKLHGTTTYSYSTQARTNIVNFYANTGAEDGSVILNFTVDGQEPDTWTIAYAPEGGAEQQVQFTGHMTTVTGLEVGKTYTFRLVPSSDIYLVGTAELTYTAGKVVQAENLAVANATVNSLTVSWTAPEDVPVESWSVRCYSDSGYDNTQTVTDCTATFTNIDTAQAHTIEVTAAGMTVCARTYITANPVTVTTIHGNNDDPTKITLSWEFNGNAPEGGWLLLYTIDDSEDQQVIQCAEPQAVVEPKVPGSHYAFTLQAANGSTVFGGTFSADAPKAETFAGYDVSTEDMEFWMCRTPEVADWSRSDLEEDDYTSAFASGEKASILVHLNREYNVAYDEIVTAFVIRTQDGTPVSVNTTSRSWEEMWNRGYCELDIPVMPTEAGSYTVEIYFNGAAVTTQEFTVE